MTDSNSLEGLAASKWPHSGQVAIHSRQSLGNLITKTIPDKDLIGPNLLQRPSSSISGTPVPSDCFALAGWRKCVLVGSLDVPSGGSPGTASGLHIQERCDQSRTFRGTPRHSPTRFDVNSASRRFLPCRTRHKKNTGTPARGGCAFSVSMLPKQTPMRRPAASPAQS